MLLRHRRALSAGASALAVLSLGLALRPPTPAMHEVVVAAADLATGHRLGPADLATTRVPAAVLPPGSTTDPAALVGTVLAAPVLGGEPLSAARLVGSLADVAAPPGTVAAPVRFADSGAVALLSAGRAVEVLASRGAMTDDLTGTAAPATARVVASRALVLAVVEPRPDSDGVLSGGTATAGPLVVLALTPAEARAVAGAEAGSRLSFTLPRAG